MVNWESETILTRTTRTNSDFTAPVGVAAGKTISLIFEIAAVGAPPTPTPPSGFVLPSVSVGGPYPAVNTDGSFISQLFVWNKVATGSEPGTYTVTHASAITGGYMFLSNGAITVTPVSDSTIGSGGGNPATAPGLNVPVAGSLVCGWANYWDPGSVTEPSGTTPTFTNRYNPTSGTGLHVWTGVMGASGPTGDKTTVPPGSPWSTGLFVITADVPLVGGAGGSLIDWVL